MPVLGDAEGGQPPAGGAGAEGGEASGYRSDNIYVRICTFIQCSYMGLGTGWSIDV